MSAEKSGIKRKKEETEISENAQENNDENGNGEIENDEEEDGDDRNNKKQRLENKNAGSSSENTFSLTNDQSNRRLDSFARLLEGKSECAAVCRIGNEIIVTSNKICPSKKTHKQPTGDEVQHIINLFKYFAKPSNFSEKKDIENLKGIWKKRFISITKGATISHSIKLDDETIEKVIKQLLDDRTGRKWIKSEDDFFTNFLTDEEKMIWESRKGKNEKKIKLKILEIDKKLTAVRIMFSEFWRYTRDFKKIKDYFSNNQNINLKLLSIGTEGEHAEARLIGYLLETGKLPFLEKNTTDKEAIFIGISKLCCSSCMHLVNKINEELPVSQIGIQLEEEDEEKTLINKDDISKAAKKLAEKEKEKIEENEEVKKNRFIETSGTHDLGFESKWTVPAYMKGEAYLDEEIQVWVLKKENSNCDTIEENKSEALLKVNGLKGFRKKLREKFEEEFKETKGKKKGKNKGKDKNNKTSVSMQTPYSLSPSSSSVDSSQGGQSNNNNVENVKLGAALGEELADRLLDLNNNSTKNNNHKI